MIALVGDDERLLIAQDFGRSLPVGPRVERHLAGALRDALATPGSLARAQLAFSVARRFGLATERALALGTALEYFHTASLLFDDLPSMDDARDRRGKACVHTIHGEGAATLAALALITRAYSLLWGVLGTAEPSRAARAAELVSQCLGVEGILNGQARDLHFDGGGAEDVLEVARGKTVTLIRLTLVLPALVGGAAEAEIRSLETLAESWGLAYQVADDFKDKLWTRDEAGKSIARDGALGRPNLPGQAGVDVALEHLERLLARAAESLESLTSGASWPALDRLHALLRGEIGAIRQRVGLRACA
ncbi:MAG: polyprenyl synthetase family protein [Thermoanaerobaculia bacterium]